MKARPILMSGPMVRALLAGTKTQTRRVVKPQPVAEAEMTECDKVSSEGWQIAGHSGIWWDLAGDVEPRWRCPYGIPGDLLWVRECFSHNLYREGCWYWADGNIAEFDCTRPKPSIHMPRWASRLTLEVTDVRVERLQDISEADAISEGAAFHDGRGVGHSGWRHDLRDVHADARSSYARLWADIHGPGHWGANPWVWALTFKVHRANVDSFERRNP